MTSLPGAGGGHTADSDGLLVREALEAAYHIAECREHESHLIDAENAARKAIPALARLEATANRTAELEAALEQTLSIGAGDVNFALIHEIVRAALFNSTCDDDKREKDD